MDKNIKNLSLSDIYQVIKSGWLVILIMGGVGMFLANILQSTSKIYDATAKIEIINYPASLISLKNILYAVEDVKQFDESLHKCQSNIRSSIYGESVSSGFRWSISNNFPNRVSLKITGQNFDFLMNCVEIAVGDFKKHFNNEANNKIILLNDEINYNLNILKCLKSKLNLCTSYYYFLDKEDSIKYLSQKILQLDSEINLVQLSKVELIETIRVEERDAKLLARIASFYGFMIGSLLTIIFIMLMNVGIFFQTKSD